MNETLSEWSLTTILFPMNATVFTSLYIYIYFIEKFIRLQSSPRCKREMNKLDKSCVSNVRFDGDFFLIALINYGWINCNKNPRKVGNYVTLRYDTRWLSDGNNVLTRMLKRGGVSKTNREGNVFVEIFCANYRATSPSGNYFVNPGVLGRRKSAPSHSHGEK